MEEKGENKRIVLYVLIIVLILFAVAVYVYRIQEENNKGNDEPLTLELLCSASGGKWITFNNGCADNCGYVRNKELVLCTQALTESCDCGQDMCWNGEGCEEN